MPRFDLSLLPFLLLLSLLHLSGRVAGETNRIAYDNTKTHLDIGIGSHQICTFTPPSPADESGSGSGPVAEREVILYIEAAYTYPFDGLRTATLTVSKDGTLWTLPKSLPFESHSSALTINMTTEEIVYIRVDALSMPGASAISVDLYTILWVSPTKPLYSGHSGLGVYGYVILPPISSSASAPALAPAPASNQTSLSFVKTVWYGIVEGEMFLFRYLSAGEHLYLRMDLQYAMHSIDIYGRSGEAPTTGRYDWKATNGNTGTGTVTTDQTLSPGVWYFALYGENVVWPASTATSALELSSDGTFEDAASSTSLFLFSLLSLLSLPLLL